MIYEKYILKKSLALRFIPEKSSSFISSYFTRILGGGEVII